MRSELTTPHGTFHGSLNVMRCLPCDTEMRFVGVAPCQAMVSTQEMHTFECPNCRRTERRLVFAHDIGRFQVKQCSLHRQLYPGSLPRCAKL
jgi:hypothetical protein